MCSFLVQIGHHLFPPSESRDLGLSEKPDEKFTFCMRLTPCPLELLHHPQLRPCPGAVAASIQLTVAYLPELEWK